MSLLRLYYLKYFKYLLASFFVLHLVACSGGDGDGTGAPAVINILGVNWAAPVAREDGTAISPSEIAGFRIYYGTAPGDYQNQIDIDDSSSVQTQVVGIPAGTYYVVVTAVDTGGRESLYSTEVVVTL